MTDVYQKLSIVMSVIAIVVSGITAYFQYQSRQDSIGENIKIELRMRYQKQLLSSLDLRMISGSNERTQVEAAILITNMGNTTVRIVEVGYQDLDLPTFAFYGNNEKAKTLAAGEQATLALPNLVSVTSQLVDDVKLGADKAAKVFAVTTKGNRFEVPAIIEVSK